MKVNTAALRVEVEHLPDPNKNEFVGWYELGEVRRQKILAMIDELDRWRSLGALALEQRSLGEHRELDLRKMGPLSSDHPLVADVVRPGCPGCGERFVAGDYVTLITVGPGDDAEEQEKARAGRPYNAIAMAAHWRCATGSES